MSQVYKNQISAAVRSFAFVFEKRNNAVLSVRCMSIAEKNTKIRQQQYTQAWLCQMGGY